MSEALVSEEPPYDEQTLKPVIQHVLFSRTGRLGLYFEQEYARLVGQASTAAATLQAVANRGPIRLTDVARAIGASTASTVRYLERLGDALLRDEHGLYRVADTPFATWVRWRSPGGTVVPMNIVGDEAERAVVAHLASLGFTSRGRRPVLSIYWLYAVRISSGCR